MVVPERPVGASFHPCPSTPTIASPLAPVVTLTEGFCAEVTEKFVWSRAQLFVTEVLKEAAMTRIETPLSFGTAHAFAAPVGGPMRYQSSTVHSAEPVRVAPA